MAEGGGISVYIGTRGMAVVVAVAALVTGAFAVPVITGGGGGGGDPVANVWFVESGGTCSARQSTPLSLASTPNSAKCNDDAGNTALEAAFGIAGCGDTVLMDGGDYGDQHIDSGHSGTCAQITIAAAPGAAVVLADLVWGGTAGNGRIAGQGWDDQNPEFGTVTAGGTDPSVDSPGIVGGTRVGFDGIDYVSSGEINGGTDVFVLNSDIGPLVLTECPPSGMPIANTSGHAVDGLTFDGNYVHEFGFVGCTPPNDHMDCIHIYEFLTGPSSFSNNVIEDCINYGFLFGGTSDLVVENNWFGETDFCGLAFHGGAVSDIFDNVTIQNNSGIGCIGLQVANTITDTVVRGNAVTNVGGACRSGVTYSYNKQSQGAGTASVCGTGDAISQSFAFASTTAGALDFHIASDSPLKDAGGATCPSTDYDGDTRPAGAACDVGADEVG